MVKVYLQMAQYNPQSKAMDVITKLVQAIPVPINRRGSCSNLPSIPEVPGLPIVGNLLQLMERKPHFTFNEWANTYGPIYSIRAGATSIVVLNSNDLAKEAMVTRLSSLSTRNLPSAMRILSCDKAMVSLRDYDEYYLAAKRLLLANVLGGNAQKRHRGKRDILIENTLKHLHAHLNDHPLEAVNFRRIFQFELFGFALKQTIGKDIIESIHVQELEATLSREERFNFLVKDMMEAVIEMDWRDYFPYLKWIPNNRFEEKIHLVHTRRLAVMKALVREASQSNAEGKEADCYLDFLLTEAKTLSAKQKIMLLWEIIISTSDTTAITTEWAMYELAKDQKRQDRLQREIINVCGNDEIKEEHLCRLPYLCAVFHETLRKHSPAPITLPKYAHENTQLGGYHVPANTEIAINIYGCNMDNKVWENPKEWKPERFLDEKYIPSDSYNTMAFGGGKRACSGANEAMLISCMAIGRMIQDFEWRLKDGDEENVETKAYTTHKLHPLQAHLKPRR